MGNFIHHISGGVLAGAACGVAAGVVYHLAPMDALAGGVLCTVGSILPDIDSPQSKPTEMMFGLASILAPMMAIQTIGVHKLTTSQIVVFALGGYFVVKYLVQNIVHRFTVHRGMVHSIPMACIWGLLVYLAFRHSPPNVKNIVSCCSAIGFSVHLWIDEMFSFVNFEGVRISPKLSFGTAFKFFSNTSMLANFVVYIGFAILLYLSLQDAGMV